MCYNYSVNIKRSVSVYIDFSVNFERGNSLMKRKLTVLMAIMLVFSMLVCFASCGSSDDESEIAEVFSTEEAVYTESATPIETTSEDVLEYFNGIVNELKLSKPAISYKYEINVPDSSIKITKAGQEDAEETDESLASINDGAKGVKDMILSDIKKESGNIEMGADNSEYLFVKGESWASQLTVSDIDYATMKEIGDNYYIEIAFNDIEKNADDSALRKSFNLRDKEEILASEEFAKTSEYLKFNDYDVAYSGCKITATVNRITNEITNLNYYKAANVVAHMTGAGTFADYGDVSIIFTLEDKSNFDINWESELPTSPLETASAQ